ncbi:hypothetical protein BDP27DRAFT_1429460 [Rhodocollybia butyracea]|uniref:Bacteriophage T5 Orf172 DNA-binding domain-containing protein n=1 Tax=Rhodocollybia butyracea TaxID=206335 RepID=A0A9P5U058_9AGAR|nr:hypothetical protein BDP27DRAFT_1429460 [Rhodocollybia butyracea]
MSRRPNYILRRLFNRRRRRPISTADGIGFIYIIRERVLSNGCWILKIGMTNSLDRRLKEHRRDCPNPNRRLWRFKGVGFRRRVEALFHLKVESISVDRPRTSCPFCHRRHQELFMLTPHQISNKLLPLFARLS